MKLTSHSNLPNLNAIEGRASALQAAGGEKMSRRKPRSPKDRVSLSRTSKTVSDGSPEQKLEKKKWAVLFYLDADNRLSPMALESFRQLKKTGGDENLHLGVLLSAKGHPVKRGLITTPQSSKTDPFPEGHLLAATPESYPLADNTVLERFLQWGARKCPAEHYALVMSGSGQGILGVMEKAGGKEILTNQELAAALEKFTRAAGKKIEVLTLETGLSAGLETAYQVKDGAGYLVASQELENTLPLPGLKKGLPHQKILADLKDGLREKGDLEGEELAKLFVFEAQKQLGSKVFTPTQSALELSQITPLAQAADRLAGALLKELKAHPEHRYDIAKAAQLSQKFLALEYYDDPHNRYRDLQDFTQKIQKAPRLKANPHIQAACGDLLDTLKKTVVAEHHTAQSVSGTDLKNSHGISVYLPLNYGKTSLPDPLNPQNASPTFDYQDLAFARDSQWAQLLDQLSREELLSGKLAGEELLEAVEDDARTQLDRYLDPLRAGVQDLKDRNYRKLAEKMLAPLTKDLKDNLNKSYSVIFKSLHGGSLVYKGASKVKQAAKNPDYTLKNRLRIGLEGSIDAAQGLKTISACEGLLAGGAILNTPGALALIGLRIGWEIAAGLNKSRKADKMSLDEKLAGFDKSPVKKENDVN